MVSLTHKTRRKNSTHENIAVPLDFSRESFSGSKNELNEYSTFGYISK